MKIFILDHQIKAGGNLGVPFLIKVLFKGLAQKGYEPTLITSKENAAYYQTSNARIIDISHAEVNMLLDGRTPIAKFCNQGIFHSHTSGHHVNFDLSNFNGKWVATCHGSDYEDGAAEFLVFVSKSQMLRHCMKFNSHIRSRNIYLAYNCYESGLKFNPGSHNKLIYFGVLRKDKGIHYLPEIAQNIGRAIHIYGPMLEFDKGYIEKSLNSHLGYSVHYHGPVESLDEKNHLFSEAELLVHPATFHEPFGIALVESMACGVPFVGFNLGALPELNIDRALLGENVSDLSEIMKLEKHKLYSPDDLISHASLFSEENFVSRYESIYRDLLSFPYN